MMQFETLAREKLAQMPPDAEAVKAVKKGIHWKDSAETCSKDVLICLLNIDPLAEIQVGQMKKLHKIPSLYHNCTGFPADIQPGSRIKKQF